MKTSLGNLRVDPLLWAIFWGLYGGLRGAKGEGTEPLFWNGVYDALIWGGTAAFVGTIIGLIGSNAVRIGTGILLVIMYVWTLTEYLTGIFYDGFPVQFIARGIVGSIIGMLAGVALATIAWFIYRGKESKSP
jgi:hypothetical protein